MVMRFLSAIDRVIAAALRWICILCLVGLFAVLLGMVLIRFVPIARLSWSSEVIELLFAWLVFSGAAALWRTGEHFRIEALSEALGSSRPGLILTIVVEILALGFIVLFAHYGLQLTLRASATSPILALPRTFWYLPMPMAGVIMAVYSVRNLARHARHFRQLDGHPDGAARDGEPRS
ncbi:MAG: TRAP transporter small permease [Rhodospirillaceae bacterium]|nr:TRAP transporter small permease [Rhodospirillaceae bacterium]